MRTDTSLRKTLMVRFYQAECGDAALLSFIGSDGKRHNIFIDSGYERTYHHVLASEIKRINSDGDIIDIWIISHIHDDHIGGAISYTKSIQRGYTKDLVVDWIYNQPRGTLVTSIDLDHDLISQAKSAAQGDDLIKYLISINKSITQDIISGYVIDCWGMKFVFISPSQSALDALRSKYSTKPVLPLEGLEEEDISLAKASKSNDYHIPVSNFVLNSIWQEDDSIENGSSIAFITYFEDIKILWLADSHPSIVVESMKSLGYSSSNPLVCDWVKVSHHGSKGSGSNELYEMVKCNNYVLSVNGNNRHSLPNKESVVRIIRNSNRSYDVKYNIYFTYNNGSLRNMFASDPIDVFDKYNFNVQYNSSDKWIEIKCL